MLQTVNMVCNACKVPIKSHRECNNKQEFILKNHRNCVAFGRAPYLICMRRMAHGIISWYACKAFNANDVPMNNELLAFSRLFKVA